MGRKPTLRDVSVLSGLSTYTVSRALTGATGVSESSRQAVLAAAREVGYVPNAAAQQLRKNTRSSVSVITASTSNHYYVELMRGIDRALRATGRTALVADIAAEGHYSEAFEDRTVQHLIQSRTAGVISTLTLQPHNVDLLHEWDIPVVFVDAAPPADTHLLVPAITTDNAAASGAVGDHLAGHGAAEWLLLAYPARWSTRIPREAGLQEAARRHGARLTVVESENDVDSGVAALRAHLDAGHRPDALVAGNNPLLLAALRVLRERGLRIPVDVAVVAFDEFPWAPLLDPPLTVLDEHSEVIGEVAAQTLTRVIDAQVMAEEAGGPSTPVYRPEDRREVAFDLVVRRSCGC